MCRSRGARSASTRALGRDTTDGGLDQWRAWSAHKLPGRPACKYVRGWEGAPLSIEVHRTACIVTHPPGSEGANDALSYTREESLGPCRVSEPCPAPLRVAMCSPLPFPCVPDRPSNILLVEVGTLSFSHPSFGVSILCICLFRPQTHFVYRGGARYRAQAVPTGRTFKDSHCTF